MRKMMLPRSLAASGKLETPLWRSTAHHEWFDAQQLEVFERNCQWISPLAWTCQIDNRKHKSDKIYSRESLDS